MTKEYTYEEALAIAEKRKDYRKKYYETHKEQIYQYHKDYNERNPEKVTEYRKNYRESHAEQMAAYRKARYDAIKNALAKGPSSPVAPKEEVVVNEATNTNTVVTQKRNRKKNETVIEPNKTETNVASNENE